MTICYKRNICRVNFDTSVFKKKSHQCHFKGFIHLGIALITFDFRFYNTGEDNSGQRSIDSH